MSAGDLSLFQHRVRDLVKRPLVTCGTGVSAVEVAQRLSRNGVGSVVVVDAAGVPVGIVTDRDLRRKVVAEALDPRAVDAAAIMSAPLVTIRSSAFAFEAALEMTRRHIRHLVVVDEERAVGVVGSWDILVLHTTHPVTLAREIDRAVSLDALAGLAARVTDLVRRLLDEGGKAYDIGQLVAAERSAHLTGARSHGGRAGGGGRDSASALLLAPLWQRGASRADAQDRPGQRSRAAAGSPPP